MGLVGGFGRRGQLCRELGVLGSLGRGGLLEPLALGLGVRPGLGRLGGALAVQDDVADAQEGQLLAVALLDAAAGLRPVLERDDLLATALTDDLRTDRGAIDDRAADRSVVAVDDEQDTVGGDAGAYDVLIVGGEDHKTGQQDDANKRFGALERWTRHRFPMVEEIEYRWSGEVLEPVDGLAFIGPNPLDEKNVFIATGDSGNGMTHGTIAGILLTDLIVGRKNPWEAIYKPSRITLKALPQFAKENLNVAMQYTDLLVAGDVRSVDEIKPGAGAVLSRGLSKVAVYRDPQGKTHELSAVCRHLGCIVNWNTSENTWDCPCHGSRYDALGKVIQGPANSDLVEEESNGERAAVSKQIASGYFADERGFKIKHCRQQTIKRKRSDCFSLSIRSFQICVHPRESAANARCSSVSGRSHVGFADVEVRGNFLHVVVIFERFHQLQHLSRFGAFEFLVLLAAPFRLRPLAVRYRLS